MPLLEETGYVPSRRYASGHEIRGYIDLLVHKWHLEDRAMFQSAGKATTWQTDHWVCEIAEKPKGHASQTIKINAGYVILGSGTFTYPKIPNVPGTASFKGQMIHTARWNYPETGGSQTDPAMKKLADKRVAIVGTGATAIQVVPELAKYARELYVVQRTAAQVDYRGNRDTDENEWKTKIAAKKNWQAERGNNLQIFTEQSHSLPEKLVDDGFSAMPSIAATFGGPSDVKPEDVAKHMKALRVLDDERSDRIRQRTEQIVKDQETAKVCSRYSMLWYR